MMSVVALVTSALVIGGAFFALAAAIGINRLPDLYTRMHAASKAGTVGSGLLLLAAGVSAMDAAVLARAIAGILFFVLTAPVAAHLLARAAYQAGYRLSENAMTGDLKKIRS